jgi:hypothetical protein
MSFKTVKSYIRTAIAPSGFNEWRDAFNIENIPSTRLHKAFHISIQNVRGDSLNQYDYQSTVFIELKHIVKGQANTDLSIDLALDLTEDILVSLLDPTARLNQTTIKNVFCEGFSLDPLDTSNDNSIIVTMNLSFLVILNVEL